MRKNVFIGVLAVLSLFLVGGVLAMADQESTTAQVDKTWELTAQTIEEIYIGGTNQPVNLVLETTDNPTTQVVVSGKVPERSLVSLSDQEETLVSDDSLHLAFLSWKGETVSHHININEGKRQPVTIRVKLGREAVLKHLELDNAGGQITVSLPEDLAVFYSLTANYEGEVINDFKSVPTAKTRLTIKNHGGDIVVKALAN